MGLYHYIRRWDAGFKFLYRTALKHAGNECSRSLLTNWIKYDQYLLVSNYEILQELESPELLESNF